METLPVKKKLFDMATEEKVTFFSEQLQDYDGRVNDADQRVIDKMLAIVGDPSQSELSSDIETWAEANGGDLSGLSTEPVTRDDLIREIIKWLILIITILIIKYSRPEGK